MKFGKRLLPALVAACSLFVSLAADQNGLEDMSKQPHKGKGCTKRTPICQKSVGKHGYVITEPGQYYLCDDIIYKPYGQNPAIRISEAAVGNVSLDLNGHTLSQFDKSVLNINGIVVDPGLTNIELKNGTVSGFSNNGIQVGDTTYANISPVTDLKISNINCFNNAISSQSVIYTADAGVAGLLIVNAEDVVLENSRMNGNAGTGFVGGSILKLAVTNCHFDDNIWANQQFDANPANPAINNAYGAGCVLFKVGPNANRGDITISHCTFDRNTSIGYAYGLFIDATPNSVIEFCTANDTSSIVSDPAVVQAFTVPANNCASFYCNGMQFSNRDLTLKNCQINRTSLTINVALSNVVADNIKGFNGCQGLNIGGVPNVVVTDCDIGEQAFFNNSGIGIRMFNQSISTYGGGPMYFSNCRTFGNFNGPSPAPTQSVVEGIDIAISNDVLIVDCVSSEHSQAAESTGLPGSFYSYVAGFAAKYFEGGSTVFLRCLASDNIDTGSTGGLAFGFTTRENSTPGDLNSTFIFDSCIAESNTNKSGTGTGFDIFNLAGSKVVNCLAEANNIGIALNDYVSASTTIAAGSNGLSLPQTTIDVASTAGFTINPNTGVGTIVVVTSLGPQTVTYTGTTATSFTGTSGGYGVMTTGGAVLEASTFDNIISNNILEANTNFGILDSGVFSGTNAYYTNQAKHNGPTPAISGSDTNYSGGILNTTGAPIRYWLLPAAPNTTNNNGVHGETLDNISIN